MGHKQKTILPLVISAGALLWYVVFKNAKNNISIDTSKRIFRNQNLTAISKEKKEEQFFNNDLRNNDKISNNIMPRKLKIPTTKFYNNNVSGKSKNDQPARTISSISNIQSQFIPESKINSLNHSSSSIYFSKQISSISESYEEVTYSQKINSHIGFGFKYRTPTYDKYLPITFSSEARYYQNKDTNGVAIDDSIYFDLTTSTPHLVKNISPLISFQYISHPYVIETDESIRSRTITSYWLNIGTNFSYEYKKMQINFTPTIGRSTPIIFEGPLGNQTVYGLKANIGIELKLSSFYLKGEYSNSSYSGKNDISSNDITVNIGINY